MKSIRRKCNLMINLSKIIYKKKHNNVIIIKGKYRLFLKKKGGKYKYIVFQQYWRITPYYVKSFHESYGQVPTHQP